MQMGSGGVTNLREFMLLFGIAQYNFQFLICFIVHL
jgi:hypothetical protein